LICLLLIAAGCGNQLPRPAEIEENDMCAQCKMAISEKQYAAEMVDRDGNVYKFDNLDCLVRYVSGHALKEKAAAWFVMDSDGKQWLDSRQAFLVKSASIPGPMGSGILAVKDQATAGGLAQRFAGQILYFEDLWSH
jgi:copper chaperone NosL